MQRKLTIKLAVIAAVAITMFVSTAQVVRADVITPSGGITLTEKDNVAVIGSHIDAFSNDDLVGSWFSSTGQLPQLVTGLRYVAHLDTSGVNRIERVELSVDDSGETIHTMIKTEKGKKSDRQSWEVELPELTVGGHSLRWDVWARDKSNRLMLIVIPINWSSTRQLSSANQVMVQRSPRGREQFNCSTWFLYLRGFVSADAEPDPSVIARSQAVRSMLQPQPAATPAPAPASQSQPAPAPVAAPTPPAQAEAPAAEPASRAGECPKPQAAGNGYYLNRHDGHRPAQEITCPTPVCRQPNFGCGATLHLGYFDSNKCFVKTQDVMLNPVTQYVGVGYTLTFVRQGKNALVARIVGINPSSREITAVSISSGRVERDDVMYAAEGDNK